MPKMKFTKSSILLCGIAFASLTFASCSDDEDPDPDPTPTSNTAVMITNQDKLDMIYSLSDLEGYKGRIYEMTYDVDYKLDDALNFQIDCTDRLKMFVAAYLMDKLPNSPSSMNLTYTAGCSAFACPDTKTSDHFMGRNFDFNHKDANGDRIMIPVIAVHTAPAGGKKSVSFVDGQFVGYASGFYTDGKSDLSMLMALPYLLLDGINEDGFAISVLKLDGLPTLQQEEGKKKIFTTVAMRMLLDRASTVKEAIEMLKQYNMCMDKDPASYHFFMADAKGDYAIVEYTNSDLSKNPDKMEVLTGKNALRYVTNFYVSPTMAETAHGSVYSTHGKDRYETLEKTMKERNYKMTSAQALELLKSVAQGPNGYQGSTGFTQWTEVYNLNSKKVTMSILREWNANFTFKVK